MYPDVLNNVIASFKKIPGVGEKSAERYALSLLDLSEDEINKFSCNMIECKKKMRKCDICGHLTDQSICSICSDDRRDKNLICVVEDFRSVIMFEKSGTFNGYYHVLDGLISPMDGVFPDDINIDSLLKRVLDNEEDGNNSTEIILALKPSIEGEATTLYISKMFESKKIKVSRLSYGIPMGVELDYLDSLTLDRALLDRKEVS